VYSDGDRYSSDAQSSLNLAGVTEPA
jgi:hypothetical protein